MTVGGAEQKVWTEPVPSVREANPAEEKSYLT